MLKRLAARLRRAIHTPRVRVEGHPGLTRLGSEYGGWWVRNTPELQGGSVLSMGLGEDASFDVEIAARYGAKVVIVDPTPKAVAHYAALRGRLGQLRSVGYVAGGKQPVESYDLTNLDDHALQLVAKAIWKEEGFVRFYAPANPDHVSHSIEAGKVEGRSFLEVPATTYTSLLGTLSATPALVKMDIEGAEIVALNSILESGALPQQLLIEFDVLQTPGPASQASVEDMDRRLRAVGYACLHYDGLRNYLYALPETTAPAA